MWGRKSSKYLLLVSICLIMVLMLVSVVYGRPFRLPKLPDQGKNFGCGTCHIELQSGGTRNPFGQDWEKIALNAGDQYTPELGKLDSDNDKFTNDQEFTANTNPGDPNSKPSNQANSTPDPKVEFTKVLNRGKAVFNDPKLGKSGMSCNSCHPNGGTTGGQMMGMSIPTLKGVAATFPKYKVQAKNVITLQQANNTYIQMIMKGNPHKLDSSDSVALAVYITSFSNGVPVQVGGK